MKFPTECEGVSALDVLHATIAKAADDFGDPVRIRMGVGLNRALARNMDCGHVLEGIGGVDVIVDMDAPDKFWVVEFNDEDLKRKIKKETL